MKTRREMLEEFVDADPQDSFSRYALALELEKEKRELDAIAQLQEVIARDPAYVAAYYHLGRILARLGHIEDARGAPRAYRGRSRGLSPGTCCFHSSRRPEDSE